MNVKDNIDPIQDPSGVMAEFFSKVVFDDLTEDHRDFIKRDLLDGIGVMIAGTRHEVSRKTLKTVREWVPANSGKSRVVVYGDSLSPVAAAFANGTFARICDLGDAHAQGGHINEWVVPALLSALPLSESPVTGKDFMTAFAVGAEWGIREQANYRLQEHIKDTPGECGGNRFATGAIAKMLGFNKEQMWTAQGMAYEINPIGEMQKYNESVSTVFLQHGYGCSNAIKSVTLARNGLTSIKGIYMGQGGQLKIMKYDCEGPDYLVADLGKNWVWLDDSMKAFAGCKYSYPTMWGVLRMMKEHGFTWRDIEAIDFTVSMGCRVTIEPYETRWNPVNQQTALWSNAYTVAYAAVYGDVNILSFQDEEVERNMADPAFRDLMNRMHFTADGQKVPDPFEGYLMHIVLKDGREIDHVESDVPGYPKNPMTWEQVAHKFRICTKLSAIDLGTAKYEGVIEFCRNLEQKNDMNELVELLVP